MKNCFHYQYFIALFRFLGNSRGNRIAAIVPVTKLATDTRCFHQRENEERLIFDGEAAALLMNFFFSTLTSCIIT